MHDVARFSGCTLKFALLAVAVVGVRGAWAASEGEPLQKADCKIYEQQEQANLIAQTLADPSIHAARLDTIVYSAQRNTCLASVFFTKGNATYCGIVDISANRMIWAKSYKGTNFTPVRILAMDAQIDEKIQALASTPETSAEDRSFNFLPSLLDRTMNTLPAIKNALTEER